MATKHNDDDGHLVGGRGIDHNKDNSFSRKGMDKEAVRSMFQQRHEHGGLAPVDTDYFGKADTAKGRGSRMLNGAREGTDPILSRGDETHPSQTGIRERPRRQIRGSW